MDDFEYQVTSATQKKFVDIIPPSGGRVGSAKNTPLSGRTQEKTDSIPRIKEIHRQKEEIRKTPVFLKKKERAKGGFILHSIFSWVARIRLFAIKDFWKIIPRNVRSQTKQQQYSRGANITSFKRVAGFGLGLLLVASGIWGYRELPRVKVVLHPMVLDHSVKLEFEGRTSAAQIDYQKGIVPLELLSFTLRQDREFPSTGIEERILKARGVITVFNAYSSESQLLVERTRFISEDGHLFRTTKKITIPGAKVQGGTITPSSQDAEVEAAEAGSEYNIGPSTFSIPGFAGTPRYLGFYGKSKNAMNGGFVGEIEVVTGEDLERAKKELERILSQKAQEELLLKLPSGFEVVGDALNTIEAVTFSLKAGEAGKSFKADAAMTVKAFIVRSQDLIEFIEQGIGASLPPSMEEVRSMRNVQKKVNESDVPKGILKGAIDISTKMVHKFSQEEFHNLLKGKDSEGVRTALYQDVRIKKALVSFWPMWAKKVPENTSKIRIEVAPPGE